MGETDEIATEGVCASTGIQEDLRTVTRDPAEHVTFYRY